MFDSMYQTKQNYDDYNQINDNLDPKFLLEKPAELDNLTCSICLNILYWPVDCKECDSSFCKPCIQAWNQRDTHCPLCKTNIDTKPAHKIIRGMLSSLKFKCRHQKRGCSYSASYSQMINHQCDIYCKKCQIGLKKEAHDCAQLLMKKVKELQAKVPNPKNSFLQCLSKDLIAIQPQGTCNSGHKLQLLNRFGSWFCDKCKIRNCRHSDVSNYCSLCDYDVCGRCSNFKITDCKALVQDGEQKLVRKIKKGQLVIITSSQYSCKHCKNRLKLTSKLISKCDKCQINCPMMWSCGQCKFVLCPQCSPIHILSNDIIKPEPRQQYYSC